MSAENRNPFIPYGRQLITEDDVAAVTDVLRSDWLTTGPQVVEFEAAMARFTGARHAAAVCNGTAGLHAAMHACGIGPGDEVIVPSMTFAATANSVLYQGATPVFVDVEPGSLLLDPGRAAAKISSRTKAIVAVDYAGHPCDYDALRELAEQHGVILIADGCHALGAQYKKNKVGTLADLTVFSFHPVKHITTGEGGMVVTDDAELAAKIRRFRNHGISTDHRQREKEGTWYYEMTDLGFNYRITDIQCALGRSQLQKLPGWLERRRNIAARYDAAFSELDQVAPLKVKNTVTHAYHLYVVRLGAGIDRGKIFNAMREKGIGVNVHYIPVHLHPFYRDRLGTGPGLCPHAEEAYARILSLPIHQGMGGNDVARVVRSLESVVQGH